MKTFQLKTELWLPAPLDQVFPFFADAHNLEALTPPWLKFELHTPGPLDMRAGLLIDYKLRVRGLPLRWRSEITAWDPPHRFVDAQRKGPYRRWVHEHSFEARDGGTLVRDRVDYAVPGGALVQWWFVGPDLERIFAFRHRQLEARFGAAANGRAPRAAPEGETLHA